MSSSNPRPKVNSASFEDVVDLGSIPPPPGAVGPDVHAARTAIAAMPSSLLEELRRVKAGEKEKRHSSFTNEAPTRPGKDGMRLLRPVAPDAHDIPPSPPASDLVSAVTAVVSKEAVTEAPPPPPSIVKTPPMPVPAPVIAAPFPAPVMPRPAPPFTTPLSTPAPVPGVVLMADQSPQEEPRPVVRIEILVAAVVVGGAALVFAFLAIAARVFSHP